MTTSRSSERASKPANAAKREFTRIKSGTGFRLKKAIGNAGWEARHLNLAPLLDAAPQIPLHAFAAMAAFVLGVVQLAAPKGTLPHRTIGWIWVMLMAVVALSSFWIHQIRLVGPFSP
ncbi:MAG TPA: hypothetical protein VG798_05705, partial [Rhizomicrobium sp.]|nr:hypothetical protein [Rhizomicrobium sp.]